MTLTLADAIYVESFFKVTVGSPGTITTEQLTLLQSEVAESVTNFAGGRNLSEDLKTRITALFILDLKQNGHGKGTIIKETVTDSSWQTNIKSSSSWMDRAISLRDEFDVANSAKNISTSPVIRIDSHIDGVVEGPPYRGNNYPYADELEELEARYSNVGEI